MNVQQPASSLNTANWHDKQARGCAEIAKDEPRIAADIRERAKVAAVHHRASAAGLRLAAADISRKFFTARHDSLHSENSL